MANNLPVVSITNGAVTTLSTDVAAFFDKRHDLVLRAIETAPILAAALRFSPRPTA